LAYSRLTFLCRIILHLVIEQPLIFLWDLKLSQVQAFDWRAHGWIVIFPRNPSFVRFAFRLLLAFWLSVPERFREFDTAERVRHSFSSDALAERRMLPS
jgi:hypothetical protein